MLVRRPATREKRSPIRIALAALGLAFLLLLAVAGTSLTIALRQPTGEDTSVKLAEWARDHGLGAVVTAAEYVQYRLNPPVTGGAPDAAVLNRQIHKAAGIPLHAPLVTPVQPALPGEGKFVAVGGATRRGDLEIAYMRPDPVHTSYLAGIAWMSHKDRFVLHPGFQDPGLAPGWTQQDHVNAAGDPSLLATFNGGFKIKDANGGYFDHGRLAGQLVAGAASLVIYKDGHAAVGTWGQDLSMTPDVAYVRQNLKPLISGGHIASDLNANVESNWGATIGGDLAVWRSGLGETSTGDLVYVSGDALTVTTLADLLHRAGAVNAMQLDINVAWTSFMYYHPYLGKLVPKKMGDFQRPVNRYFQPTSRDFVSVQAPTS